MLGLAYCLTPLCARAAILPYIGAAVFTAGFARYRFAVVFQRAFRVASALDGRSARCRLAKARIIPAWFWLAVAVVIAMLVIVSVREHRAGRPF
jgi:hypothetical protein